MAKKRKKVKGQSYDHMQGSPMDVQNHPAYDLPDPTGGAFGGLGAMNPVAMGAQGE